MRQRAVVRSDTRVQFQRHVLTPYTGGRLLSGKLLLRVYPFSYAVVRLRRMTFRTNGRTQALRETEHQ